MVPKCSLHKSQPQGIVPSTCHIVQRRKIIFRDSLYILGEDAIIFDLKEHYGQTIEASAVTSPLSLCSCGLGRIAMGKPILSPSGEG